MRLVVDTNVFVSGVFFTGPPFRILDAWRRRKVDLVVSHEIMAEYQETGLELAARFPGVDLQPWIKLVNARARLVAAPPLASQVCTDPDDDKFIACALAGGVRLIASGDRALLRVSGYSGIEVLTPRQFVDRYLP